MSEIILAWKVLISSVFRDQHFCPLPRSWSLDTRVESSHCSAAKSCLTHFIASSHLSTIWLPLSGKLQKISQRSYYITPQISSPLNSQDFQLLLTLECFEQQETDCPAFPAPRVPFSLTLAQTRYLHMLFPSIRNTSQACPRLARYSLSVRFQFRSCFLRTTPAQTSCKQLSHMHCFYICF